MRYFGRQYRINVGNGAFVLDSRERAHPLNIDFSTDELFGGFMSTMELNIYNLSFGERSKIREGDSIVFDAGYPESFGEAFLGKVTNINDTQEGVERKTSLYCWSGVDDVTERVCSVSFGPGTDYADIVDFVGRDLTGRSNRYIGFDDDFRRAMGRTETGGYSELKPHKAILDQLADNLGFEWLLSAGKCVMMARGSSKSGSPRVISAATGLVGGVSLTFLGADFDMRLDPTLTIGDRVRIDSVSSSVNFSGIYQVNLPREKTVIGSGNYVVKAIKRKGDFYSNANWVNQVTTWREGETGA